MARARVNATGLAVLGLLLAAGAGGAGAQEWHEAYRDGLKALAQGQPARAASLLEYAVSQRPQPGRDIVTYGTNVQREYFPYLRLAQAYLQLHDLAGARSALKRSETWAREPAEERRRLAAQVEDLAARQATPAPATSPAPTVAVSAPPAVTATAPAPPATLPPAAPPSIAPAAVAPETVSSGATAAPTRPTPAPAVASSRAPASANTRPLSASPAASATASVEVVSQPPGAAVYLDDEMIGTTDPEWGRLLRSGVAPGRHRIRLALSGYQDVTEDVDVAAPRTEVRRRLAPPEAGGPDRRLVLYGVVAAVLLALTAWAVRRSAAPPASIAVTPPRPAATPRAAGVDSSSPTPARGTPPGLGSPGTHRGEDGFDYFGDYRLVAPLGRGGMASVFRAERGTEVVALKRPLAAFLEEPEFLERFLREAEIGRTLHHPNIVRILERGEVESVPYFTMELVPGETLQAWIQRTRGLDPRTATAVVVQIAEALDYAHLKGVVHRDLKPSNVMVLGDGTAKVMDYGIARARRFEGLTVTGTFLGSPEYVAPETIEGQGADGRSDLYALGVIFYETLTGSRPFQGDSPFAILRKHLTEVPPPPSAVRSGVPPVLDRIVLRLLSKTPAERYPVAEDLVLELRDFLNRAA